jgi:hypothetical protein
VLVNAADVRSDERFTACGFVAVLAVFCIVLSLLSG